MRGIGITAYSKPDGYQLLDFETPTVTSPKDVLIQVRAASMNPVDVKKAVGMLKLAMQDEFPYKLGYDCSGVVTQIGSEVTRIKVGDEVYVRVPESDRGSWCEYAKCSEDFVALKPASMSFRDAAAMPLAAMTCLQALRRYEGDLSGKTVFIPAGLSGTGSYGCQIAKHIFQAGRVITTVSSSKVPRVEELLGAGVVDEIIDYTKSDPQTVIPRGSVDFILDTVGVAMPYLSLLRPGSGKVVSISTLPSGDQMQSSSVMRVPGSPGLPRPIRFVLNALDSIRRYRARRWKVGYEYMFLEPNWQDLEILGQAVEQGQLRSVVGTEARLADIEAVRMAAQMVYSGKGGVGKAVIIV
ncbi:hypothetical protein N7510_001476 [Penicillium lagena]|uniref:uncharacterized protein n=1 Tax=Penicillium lagena TaxID=94218 RepID=UPI002541CD87|nr:uncharacterized protein N7510_001476 [Penicillium lagena]KAJ5625167.1 hypothetical protein N7510_001476 [Penicillium lagena]